jgi:hypothetical protein
MQQIQYDVRPGEFADAMKSTRSARMLFWLLVGVMLIFQLVAFVLVESGGVLEDETAGVVLTPARPAAPAPGKPSKAPAKKPAGKKAKVEAPAAATAPALGPAATLSKAQKWHVALRWSLPGAKFVAMVAAMLLVITLLFAVGLSLVGKLGGMAGLISAFFWSLILFAMVMPWQQVLTKSSLACGALYNLGELQVARRQVAAAGSAGWQEQALYYARFVAYPVVALLVWLTVHVKFARACMRMHYPHAIPSMVQPAATLPAADKKPGAEPTPLQDAPLSEGKASGKGSLTERLLSVKTGKGGK